MKQLAEYLEKSGISQAAFAKQVRAKQPTVCQWIQGRHMPRAAALKRISKVTGISIDKLLAA